MIIRGTTWSMQGMRQVTFAYSPVGNSSAMLPHGPKPPVTEGQDVAVWVADARHRADQHGLHSGHQHLAADCAVEPERTAQQHRGVDRA
jgi:hypothetical protein